MEKLLKLYTYVDGTNDTPFPSADEQVIIGSFTYTANRMGGAPTISATVKHRLCLDDLWNDKVYAEFNGEKYFVINTPSSSKSNDDTRYEHDLELLSEREVLNHVYFIDAVQGDSDTDVYKSNSTKVLFYGNIVQFVARLNASLSYRNLGYTAVIDDGITSEDKQVSFEDKYILEALQEEFNIFEIPYYFVGKTIHFGYTENAITTPLKYGHDSALLSISKDNANYALINRITGVGSSDNIPYYYPNETDDQSAVEASGKKWITPSQNLMPSIYRESEGAEMFYEAKNNTYPDGEGGYYQFENEYSDTNPREGKTDFEDIKPTIIGITNAAGQRIDMFSEFAYDTNDNDEVDEEGNYLHPYFFAKLKKTDGTYGFNLFDHAIESQTMQITFTSGICGACTFEIAVGEDTQKNLVQVGETSGALMRDEDGNVLCGREDLQHPQTPQDRQNDTRNYEVWIALRKDNSTYPQVMPNVNYNYKPSTSDTFAILGISLPQAYILKAEDELEKSLVKHMWMNNVEKFTFSAKFSRIFFTENPEVLAQLNENARVLIEYNGKQHTLYIDNYTYKMDSGSPLPEIDIDLVDTLSVGQNSLQTQLDSIKQDILSTVGGADFLKQGLKYFLRKDTSDTARGKITFVRGLDVGTFAENTSGGTFRVLEDLTTYAEVDKLRVRVKAYFETLEIINTNSVGGKMILTAGGGVYIREVIDREVSEDGTEIVWDYYRCYFLTQQDGREIENRFKVGDLAISQSFNMKGGTATNMSNHYYWREVVGVGTDYIDLSKSICDIGSDEPQVEDVICHLGNRTDVDRQGAIIFSAVDVFSPSITLYYGINDFSYTNKDYVSYGVDKTTGNAFFRVYGEMYAGDREQTTYMKYTPEYGVEIRGKLLTQSGKDIENTLNSFQDQIDGVKETFYGEYTPTSSNSPASEWATEEDKARHEGDVFTNIQGYVDDETTPDAGKSWRWVKNDDTGEWHWLQIADSDTSKAYLEAAKANQAAQNAIESVNEMQDTVDGIKNFTDTAFSDGIVSRGEASSISAYIKNINTFAEDVSESYSKVYNNPLLAGTDKTNLGNAYTAFNTAKDELINTINGAIADGKVDSVEKASVDGKYDAFNTKYGDFIAYLNAANKYIQDVINNNALDALDKIGELDYLKAALKEFTTIEGGLIQSSTLALGYTSDSGYQVMAGTNGIYDASKLGGGIASWWGGAMFDRFEYTEETMPENVASALVRMDGTGYFAKGNLWWESDGTLHADPLSFFVGEDSVGDVLGLFQFVKSDAGIEYVIPQYPFQKLEIGNYLQIGKAQLYWDEANQAFYARHQDGVSPIGFYTTGFISAKGANPDAGGTVSGVTKLSDLADVQIGTLATNQVLSWNGSKWVNKTIESGLDETVNVSGDTMTGTLTTCTTGTGSFNQGIRINRTAFNQWATLTIGCVGTATAGTSANTWLIGTPSSSNSLVFNLNSASESVGLCLKGQGNTDMKWNNQTVWHAGNDGSGSGLDADLLDGLHLGDIRSYGYAMQVTTIDASGLDQNTWYPVTMDIGGINQVLIALIVSLNSGTKPSWSTHAQGFSVRKVWYTNGSGWGTNEVNRVILFSDYAWASSDPAREIGQLTASSTEYIYVRGGGKYYFYTSHGVVPILRTSTYKPNANSPQTISPTTTAPAAVYRTNAYTTDNVASATRLQTARTIWGQSFNGTANVSGNMTGVGSFTGVGQFKYGSSDESNATYGKYHRLNLGYHGIDHTDFYEQVFNFYSNGGGTTWAKIGNTNYFNGNVGIGTTSPSYKLHVAGTSYFSGAVTAASTLTASGDISTTAGLIKITKNGNTTTIGSQNATWCHIYNSSSDGFIFNKKVCTTGGSLGDTMYRWRGLYSTTGNFSGAVTVNSTIYAKTGMYSDGYVSAKGLNQSSDIRLKEKISDIRISAAAIANAPSFLFSWKKNGLRDVGSSAQYWRKVLPDAVKERDGYLEMAYGNIALVSAISLANDMVKYGDEVERLKRKVVKLENRIKELEMKHPS